MSGRCSARQLVKMSCARGKPPWGVRRLDLGGVFPHVWWMSDADTDQPANLAPNQVPGASTVYVCTNLRMSGNSCANQKSKDILKALQSRADERALAGGALVKVRPSVCMGYCGDGPNVKIIGGDFHHRVGMDDLDAILDEAEKPRKA